ncbi:MAG: putative NAD(P)H-dependent FMN-containing oxidoreductase YwqN [Syntrophorhabdus sp. PtaU1.Bin058]|nr:MAG: putative NAD(P)H-dependent FMN-containing oxidoreductase YwqN [Syntrophorhabdus sp. PtaU1.Bin058]
MKILSIIGSPRVDGNTRFLAGKFAEGAMSAGASVEEVILQKVKVGPCIDCDRCNQDGVCKLDDDFGSIVDKMKACDGVLLATPVYCCGVTAQMKAFIDRSNSLMHPFCESGMEGKPAAFIVCAGYPPPETGNIEVNHKARLETMLGILKEMKALEANVTARYLIDTTKPFDPTADTLKTLYRFCVFLRMQALGLMEAVSLGHNKDAVKDRQAEIERAISLGVMFTNMARLIKDKMLV